MTKEKKIIEIRPYSIKELAGLYRMSYKTFRKWLKPHEEAIGKKIGYYYNTYQVKMIFEKLHPPFDFTIDED